MTSLRTKVLFILGTPRSGSTIIDQVIGEAEGFWSAGEIHGIWTEGLIERDLCGCRAAVPECSFWQSVFSVAFGGLERVRPEEIATLLDSSLRTRPLELFRLLRDIRQEKASTPAHAYGEILHRMYAAIAAVSGARVVVDSSKLPVHALVASAFADVDLYVLDLVRDPRAIAYAWSRNPDAGGRPGLTDLVYSGKGLHESTAQWIFFHLVADTVVRSRLDGKYLRLRYEDFAARPQEVAARIVEFVGERPASLPFLDERRVRLGDNHMAGANRAKFRRGLVAVRVDDDWERAMSWRARLACTAMAWPLLLRYRYPLFGFSPSSGIDNDDRAEHAVGAIASGETFAPRERSEE